MNADRIARLYRWIEYATFGRALQRRRVALLPDVADARRVLVLGDGDGRFLEKLVKQNPRAHVDYVDLSGSMLELARARAGTGRVTYHLADALEIALPERGYDLIVTHFFLDCFDETGAARLVGRAARAACPHAQWMISEFRKTSWWAAWWLRVMYAFFGIATGLETRRLIDHHPLLARHGFRMMRSESAWRGLLTSQLWENGDPLSSPSEIEPRRRVPAR
jgi:ubiquinone/menaquinone biosynthesis C-methylase UbiE